MNKEHVSQDYAAEVLDTCLKAGRLMIEGGSEKLIELKIR